MRRLLNSTRIEYIAPRHARMMGMFEDADAATVAKAMQNKNEIYDIDLYPKRDVADQARADFDSFRTGTPAMLELGEDMRKFYSMNTGESIQPELITEAAQLPIKAQQQAATELTGAPVPSAPVHPAAKPTVTPTPSAPVTPSQQAANDLKDDYVNHTVGYDVQETYDKLMSDLNNLEVPRAKGFLLEDPLADAALWSGAALLAGGVAGNAASEKPPKTKEELMEYVKNNPELMVSYVQ